MNDVNLGPFLGENNRLPDYRLVVPDVGTYVRSAVNCDLTNSGTFRMRAGRELVHAMTGAHSGTKKAGRILFVRASALYEITDLAPYTEVLLTTLASNARMTYAEHNGVVYFSNGTDIGRLFSTGVEPVAMATPSSPVLTAVAGTMEPGWYQVALSYVNAAGEESGVTPSSNIELTTAGGIYAVLPAGTTGATKVNIYVSAPNGEVPMLLAQVAVGTLAYTINSVATGRAASDNFLQPMPAGRLAIHNGRLLSYSSKTLTYSDAFNLGLTDPKKNYILFENDIELAVPAQNGVYVMDGRTRWFAGADIDKVEGVIDVLPYGAVPGTEFEMPQTDAQPLIGWMGRNGVVLGDISGGAHAVQEKQVAVVTATDGFSFIHEREGVRSVVVKLTGTQTSHPLSPVLYDIASTTYAVNLSNSGTTRYDASFSANSAFKSDGVYYLLTSTGLCSIGGSKDESADIVAVIDYGRLAFGSQSLKHLSNAYVGCTSESKLNLTVYSEDFEYSYLTRGYNEKLMAQRFDLGKGLRANWFGIRLGNDVGGDFETASLTVLSAPTKRRI